MASGPFLKRRTYSRDRYSPAISSSLVSRGLPGQQASAKADWDRNCTSSSLRMPWRFWGDAHVLGELLDGGDGGVGGLVVGHLVQALHAHGLGDGAVALARHGLVVLQAGGQDDGAGHAVGGVVQGGEAVGHGVDDAQAHIGEAHAGDVLAQGHALPALGGVVHSAPQGLGDNLDGFEV